MKYNKGNLGTLLSAAILVLGTFIPNISTVYGTTVTVPQTVGLVRDTRKITSNIDMIRTLTGVVGLPESIHWQEEIEAYDSELGEGEKGRIPVQQLFLDTEDMEVPGAHQVKLWYRDKKGNNHIVGKVFVYLEIPQPVLTMGKATVHIKAGEPIDLKEGVQAMDPVQGDISHTIQILDDDGLHPENPQAKEKGRYKIQYKVTNRYGGEVYGTRTYEVFKAPQWHTENNYIAKGSKFHALKNIQVLFDSNDGTGNQEVTNDVKLLANPVNTQISGEYNIVYKYSYKDLSWEFIRSVEVGEHTGPQLSINNTTITATSKTIDLVKALDCVATDSDGTNISDRITVDETSKNINLKRTGEYLVTLKVQGKEYATEQKVKVKVVAHPPTLQTKNIQFEVGQTVSLADLQQGIVEARDKVDGEIKHKVRMSLDTVDTSKKGINKVVCQVTNSNNLTTTTSFQVKIVEKNKKIPTVAYSGRIQGQGWQEDVENGQITGLFGKGRIIDGLKIHLENCTGDVVYTAHVQDRGWEEETTQGNENCGQAGKQIEGLAIRLTGEVATKYDVYYQVQVDNIGWLDWAKNGEKAGSSGYGYGIQSFRVLLIEKGENAPGGTKEPFIEKREAKIEYATHVQNIGWQDPVRNNQISGTSGKSLRLEAIKIKLTGNVAEKYDVYYRVHVQNFGWLDWAKNGEAAGSTGLGYRLEGIEIQLVEKGKSVPGKVSKPFIEKELPKISYTAHVQNFGWQVYHRDGEMVGTSGQGLRLEGVRIQLGQGMEDSSVEYTTHVQNLGWQEPVRNNHISGTSGKSLRLEAIKIKLTGKVAEKYDIYYRVHVQNLGWQMWKKNGEMAGTEGLGYRLEGLEIKLVKKRTNNHNLLMK